MFGKGKKGKKSGDDNTVEFNVTVVPVQGKTTTTPVRLDPTGVSVADVLKAAGIKADAHDITVNGQPANLHDHVVGGQVDVRAKVKVQVAERPRGS